MLKEHYPSLGDEKTPVAATGDDPPVEPLDVARGLEKSAKAIRGAVKRGSNTIEVREAKLQQERQEFTEQQRVLSVRELLANNNIPAELAPSIRAKAEFDDEGKMKNGDDVIVSAKELIGKLTKGQGAVTTIPGSSSNGKTSTEQDELSQTLGQASAAIKRDYAHG